MQLKILQLNLWAGIKFSHIKDFLQSNDFDILCFQEVTGQNMQNANAKSERDLFQALQMLLGTTHKSELAIAMHFTSDPVHAYQGNAIFYRNDFTLVGKNTLTLSHGIDPFPSERKTYEEVGRNALHLTLSKEGKTFDVLTTHLPWAKSPIEEPHQTEQNAKLIAYLQQLQHSFILAGDFNLTPDQPTVLKLEKYARNLTKEYGITNTLDRKSHKIFQTLPQGIAVDYIFVSPQIKVHDFTVIDEGLSDHLGLVVTVEI